MYSVCDVNGDGSYLMIKLPILHVDTPNNTTMCNLFTNITQDIIRYQEQCATGQTKLSLEFDLFYKSSSIQQLVFKHISEWGSLLNIKTVRLVLRCSCVTPKEISPNALLYYREFMASNKDIEEVVIPNSMSAYVTFKSVLEASVHIKRLEFKCDVHVFVSVLRTLRDNLESVSWFHSSNHGEHLTFGIELLTNLHNVLDGNIVLKHLNIGNMVTHRRTHDYTFKMYTLLRNIILGSAIKSTSLIEYMKADAGLYERLFVLMSTPGLYRNTNTLTTDAHVMGNVQFSNIAVDNVTAYHIKINTLMSVDYVHALFIYIEKHIHHGEHIVFSFQSYPDTDLNMGLLIMCIYRLVYHFFVKIIGYEFADAPNRDMCIDHMMHQSQLVLVDTVYLKFLGTYGITKVQSDLMFSVRGLKIISFMSPVVYLFEMLEKLNNYMISVQWERSGGKQTYDIEFIQQLCYVLKYSSVSKFNANFKCTDKVNTKEEERLVAKTRELILSSRLQYLNIPMFATTTDMEYLGSLLKLPLHQRIQN